MVSKKEISTPEKKLKQTSLSQYFKKGTPSPIRLPPISRRNAFAKEEVPPLSPIPFNIEDIVNEKPEPHEVLFVNPDEDVSLVQCTFQQKLDVLNNPHLAKKYGVKRSTIFRWKKEKKKFQQMCVLRT